jgi:ATP-binding cassette subfamily F protein 3
MSTFGGTMIFVSHNRAFVNRLATRIWDIEAGHLEEYPGKLKDYMERFRYRSFDEEEDAGASQQLVDGKAAGKQAADKKTAGRKTAAAAEKTAPTKSSLSRNEERRLQRESERLEKRISELEQEQAERGQRLSDPDVYGNDDYQELLGQWQATQEKLEELMGRWERNQQQLGDTGSPG